MTCSDVIAHVVGVLLVLGFGSIALSMVIRGRLDGSGETETWGKNPIFMTVFFVASLLFPSIIVWALVSYWLE